MKRTVRARDILDYILEDDPYTKHGGTAYLGETLENFIGECQIHKNTGLKKLDEALKECGMKKIRKRSLKYYINVKDFDMK